MSEIDRRVLLGSMGAGLALVGAGDNALAVPKDTKKMPSGRPQGPTAEADMRGPSWIFGDPAERVVARAGVFFPEYLCVTYMKFKTGALIIRHGYIRLDNNVWSDAHIAAKTRRVLADLASEAGEPPTDAVWVKPNFENYSMSKPSVMVFYLDNDEHTVRFNDDPSMANIIRFTPFSASPLPPGVTAIKRNRAFRNLSPLPGLPRRAYRLDFFNTDDDGNQIAANPRNPASWFVYSMNIHLQYAVDRGPGNTSYVPIIIDPDTGNMGSNP